MDYSGPEGRIKKMKTIFEKLKEKLPGLKKDIVLAPHTTFKIGGPARYFFEAKTKTEIVQAVKAAKELSLPFFILAGGSKLLVGDKGFNGLVIKINNEQIKIDGLRMAAGAGARLNALISFCLKHGLSGLEWAAGIPGATMGGAVRGNAGAFGTEMADLTERVEVFDLKTLALKDFVKNDCKFEYRSSIFKKNPDLIILETELKLEKKEPEEIQKKIREIREYRQNNHPMDFACAGSIFINPRWQKKLEKLIKSWPDLESFKQKGIIPAGWLIEQCGLKGKKIGGAQVSEKHANFIINPGRAQAAEVIALIGLIEKEVKNKFGIELKQELQRL